MTGSASEVVAIRRSRRAGAVGIAVGVGGLAAAAALDWMRDPVALVACGAAAATGTVLLCDRRPMLQISEAGIRYARWGPATIPWEEFSGFRLTAWRGQVFVQLVARRPSELARTFSWPGRLDQRGAILLGAPRLSIAVAGLEVSAAELSGLLARHLPACG